MKKIGVFFITILLIFNFLIIATNDKAVSANDTSVSVSGYVRDKDGNLKDGMHVFLMNPATTEEIVNNSYNNGFFTFNLDNLKKGWSFGDKIRVYTSYFDSNFNSYYYNDTYLTLDLEEDSFQANLTCDKKGNRPIINRDLPKSISPGSNFSVALSASDFGRAGVIWEKIPSGFIYNGCSLSSENQDEYYAENDTILFIITSDQPVFSYNITSPLKKGNYDFDGCFLDFYKNKFDVTGDESLFVYSFSIEANCYQSSVTHSNEAKVICDCNTTGGKPPFNYRWDMNNDGKYEKFDEKVFYFYKKEGNHTVGLEVIDNNNRILSKSIDITVNTTLEISVKGKSQVEKGEAIWLNASYQNGVSPITYQWDLDDDGEYEKLGEKIIFSPQKVGKYNISLMATDDGTPPDTAFAYLIVNCSDTKILTPDIKPAKHSIVNNSTLNIFVHFKEKVDLVSSTLDNKNITLVNVTDRSFVSKKQFNLSEGKHFFKIKAADIRGNEDMFNFSFRIDVSKPVIEIKTKEFIENIDDISLNISDDISGIKTVVFEVLKNNVSLYNYSCNERPFNFQVDIDQFEEGKYQLKVTAVDEAGNQNTIFEDIYVKHGGILEKGYIWIAALLIITAILVSIIYWWYVKKQRR